MVQLIATDQMTGVLGLGQTGLSVVRYLQAQGRPCFVAEENAESPSLAALREQAPDIPVFVGTFDFNEWPAASALVVSPGIALQHEALQAAQAAGVEIICDIDLFAEACDAPIVAITGSNGKSTVTTLVGNMARRAGMAVAVGGNIGIPALDLLAGESHWDLVVLELSSFQLERMRPLGAAVACILNVTPDHIDRHGTLAAYHAAKQRIYWQCKAAVCNRADALTRALLPNTTPVFSFGLDRADFKASGLSDGQFFWQFEPLMPVEELALPGRHNQENALAALTIGEVAGIPREPMLAELREFKGLSHRCERVASVSGVDYINDSKGTNVGATLAAVRGLADGRNIVLLAGGVGKGQDFSPLRDVMQHCRAVVLIGESAGEIRDVLASHCDTLLLEDTLEAAVDSAAMQAQVGDIVLFSPACASFDMFKSYADRGDQFASIVRRMAKGGV